MRQALEQILSPREMDVLRLIVDAATNNEIADSLSISEHTVHSHVASILRKLEVSNRRHAARIYRESITRIG